MKKQLLFLLAFLFLAANTQTKPTRVIIRKKPVKKYIIKRPVIAKYIVKRYLAIKKPAIIKRYIAVRRPAIIRRVIYTRPNVAYFAITSPGMYRFGAGVNFGYRLARRFAR